MDTHDLDRLLRRIASVSLHAILWTPLLVWSDFLYPHLTAKVLAFQVLVEIAAAAVLARVLLTASTGAIAWRSPWALAPPLVLFTAYALVSALWGVDLQRSLWGFIDRQDGWILWAHFVLWTFAAAGHFVAARPKSAENSRAPGPKKSKKGAAAGTEKPSSPWIRYANHSFWVSVAVAVTALLEWLLDTFTGSLPRLLSAGVPGRASGVFGNPVALGPYLLFHFFYGLYDAWQARTRGKMGSWSARIGASALLLFVCFLGQTRGVLLGWAAGLAAGAALLAFGGALSRRAKAALGAACALAAIAALAGYALRDSALVRSSPFLYRMTHISVSESDSARMRWITWESALSALGDRPVTGWGHDNAYYALNRYYNPEHVRFEPLFLESKPTWYDKSHNAYIDVLMEKGVIGGLLLLWLVAALAASLARMKDRALAAALAAAFVAYAVSNLVSFDTFGSLFGAFLFLALVMGSARADEPRPDEREIRERSGPRLLFARAGAAAAAVLVLAAFYLQADTAAANAACLEGQTAFQRDPRRAVDAYRDAFRRFFPYAARQKLNAAYQIVLRLQLQGTTAGPEADLALEWARDALAAHPQDAAVHMILNDIYNMMALAGRSEFLAEAEARGRRALELSPGRQEAMFYLGRTYILANRAREAVALNRDMVRANPDFPVAHWFLGLSLLADQQQDEAKREIETALRMGYRFQNDQEKETIRKLFGDAGFDALVNNR